MNTPITTALKVTCAFIFSVATSGILPATAHAVKPLSLPENAAQHRNTSAFEHGSNDETNVYPQLEFSLGDIQTSAPTLPSPLVLAKSAAEVEPYPMPKLNNPSGNNGFIKVNNQEVPDTIPNNDPHVGCKMNVEFYNFDSNPAYQAEVSFALLNPTLNDSQTITVIGDTKPFIGEDSASGGNDLDAVKTYQLAFTGAPHAQQGYHVKLTIHADGSRGANVKHKVFWVQPCEQPGHVLPITTTITPEKTLSTSTVRASNTLPATLPSTGNNQLSFIFTLVASALTYVSAMILQKYRLLRI